MANLFQVWDEDIQALGAAKASDDQIEARRQQLAEHFKAKAKAAGLSSKKIYETLDQFDTYSRQHSTNEDNRLTPEEEEMAQRSKDGTERIGAIKEVGKRFKDIGLGALSGLTRMGGDIAQTVADVGDNDKSELSAQIAQGLYNVTDDIRSNYSEGTKQAKKDFWSPEGLTMGVAENLGQIAGTAALLGTGGALAGAAGVTSKAGKLLAMGTMAAPLAYSQGYGQGKESSLDEINKTSNAQLWENVKAEAKAYDDAGGTGEVPYLVSMFKEAGGDLNLMKDLMADNAGNRSGWMTVGTEPLAMGVGSLMSRGAAAGGTGVMAKFANAMNNQGMSNELARRVAAGGKLAIASQAGKIAATQMGREGVQETAQEGLEGYYAKGEGSRAAGRKGELTSEDWSSSDGNGIIQQGLQGGAIGLLMGGGGAMATLRHSSKLALEKNGLPEKHDAAIIAHEQAIANLEKATQILDLNPEDVKAQEVYAKAYDEALVATNNLEQLTGKFNALYTPEEQEVIKAKTMEGVAARAKVAEDAAKAQKELEAAQAKAAQEQQAQQNEIIKAQRDEAISRLVPILGDDVAVSDELASMGLSDEEANSLLKVDVSNAENAQSDLGIGSYIGDAYIVRQDGQPFPTEQVAQQALANKATKKPRRKNEPTVSKDTHSVVPVNGGFAIAPVVEVEKPKKPDDNEDGGVIADAPKPNAPVSPSGGVIPRVHLDRISRGLKDGKTVEEIATKIQKSLPHLTIEDVTQQVLAAQEKASKPATLDSIIGKYSDDEEVDEEIRQSAEVLKKFLPETVDDWKIDNDTFATRGAWRVSYTKPYIVTDRKTGKEVVNSTTKSAPLDGDVLLSGDEQAIKDHIKERLTKNGITPRGVKNWQLDDAVSPTGQQAVSPTGEQVVDTAPTQSIEGEYQHNKIESVKATVTKTDKGYDVDWGDEVESFTGKNAQDKTQAALKKEGFSKKNPDNDNGGVPLEPVAPKPVSPMGGNSAPQTAPKTDAEQIASAMDKTAQAITDAAHSKVVERIKNGEEIVYKQPAAIERVQQDERYQVKINDKGHAVVKNVKDAQGNWVKQDKPVTAESSHIDNGKIEEAAKDFERESQNNSELNPQESKQPTKKESLLIKIDDELDAALDDLANVFKEQGKRLSSGVDPVILGKVLVFGAKASSLYIAKGAVKFAVWAENMINGLSSKGVSADVVKPYLKQLYLASKVDISPEIRKQMDKEDDVYDFDFATLNVGQQQTKGKENELPQLDSTSTKPLEGVSANNVQGTGSQRSTGGKTSGGSGANLSGNERTGGAGLSTTRIMGDDTGEVSDTARGKGTERLAVTPAQDIATDFVITDEDNIGGGGLKTKYRNNVAAIRVLKQVESEGREATNEEQKILAKWVGWGGLYQAFRYSDGSIAKGWDKEVKELAELLTPEEMTAAVDSSVAAHYTSPKVVEAMWKAVQQLGFKNGKVLEPSVGSGNFFGAMPAKLRNSALLHGVELDNITGGIAKLLYPKAKIKAAMGFQDYTIPDGYFDLVIGNPPFGKWPITDKTRRHLDGFSIHNYFFAKSIDALREGGVLAMVVTNRLMDASNANDKARQYIDEHAELLGAVRLPNNAFLKNAGTQVTTDIIFLRKRVAGEDITTNKWMNVRQYQDKNGKTVPLNEYFHAHPEMMLGEFGAYGSMYTPDDPALVARDGQDTLALLNDAIAKLPKSVMPTVEQKSEEMAEKTAKDIPDVKVGSMFVENGDIYIRQQDSLGERQADVVTLSGKAADRVKGMINIRDAFILLRDAQLSPNKDSELPSLRKKLNVAYDNFVKTNGFINDDANKRLMRDDPSWPQLSALEEKYDKGLSAAVAKTTGEVARPVSASKAAIFNVRTQFPYATITSVSSAKDGYVESLNRYGKLDIDFVANLYGQSVGDTITELGNLIYQDPVRGWVTSSDYLSGNVKLKLQAAKLSLKAQEAAKGELESLPPIEQLHRSITALEAVIPEDIESVDIDIRAGAHWLPPKHIADFAREMLGINGNVSATYNKFDASWSVDFNQSNISAAKKTEWSTDRRTAAQILNAALNHKQSTVYDKHDDGTTTVNVEATAEANEKVANLKRAWADWIWHDDNRRVELSRLYNDIFNTDAPTVFDGQHLTLAGKIDDDVLRLRPHQKDGIWRITQSDSTLLDHVVGAGKTFTMIGGAMELRRMGKSNKPMFVVPNHLVGQWAADFIKLYPSANILAATKADFEAKNRKKLFARIATGDWDAVIVAHSSFGKVPLHPDEEAKFIKKEIEEMMEAEALARKEGGEKARNAKDIGKRRLAKEDKLKKLLATKNKDDDNVYWSELGVDSLFVDEAHEFKNLAFTSTIQRVAGLGNQAGSQKATDLFTKIVSLRDRVAGAKVVFATGTPISNTMAEMYTMQRYLDLERMVNQGTVLFDAWARTFGEVVSDWELSPAGKYKMNSRFAKFVNMPELMQGYLSFADVINRDDINRQLAARGETLGTPKIRTGKPQNIVVDRSQDQADYIGEVSTDSNGNESYPEGSLVYRAENIPKKQEKGADNMLKIMSDARKAALDMRLIDPSLSDNPKSKVNEAIRRILTTYRQWNDDKGVQLVFCDLSTPKGAIAQEKARIEELVRLADEGDEAAIKELDEMSPDELDALNSSFSVYDDMKAKLIAQGIPANQVAFIHDAKTDIQKEALFGKVRSGQIRVLIGSTAKMGAGMNVQDKLVALHHLDAPWRPSDLEQREGRIIRQKNEFYKRDPEGFEVDIMRYATKQTLDSRMWQTLEGKARFIEQIRKGDIKSRSVEDIGGEAANAAEMKAASSGNPLILEEMTLRREVQNLEAEKQRHVREQHRLKSTVKKLQEDNAYLEQQISKMEVDAKSKTPEEFEMTVGRKMFKQGEEKARERAGKALSDAAKDIYIKGESRVVGKFGDFDIVARLSYFGSTTFRVKTKSGLSYGEFSFDAEKDSMSGLTLKIANIANSIEGLLGSNKRTIENNNKEIPKVQALLSNWKDAAKLEEARKKHTEIIDQLKPKEKVKVDDVKSDEQTKPIKPKFSRGEGSGLTTTQTRAILVKRFGEKLIKALEAKGLLRIVDSVKSIADGALRSIKAYHGSPANFDKFMREFVNSGEGAQAFGWGHYLAGRKALGEWYRTVLSNDFNRTSFIFRKDGERIKLTDLYTPAYPSAEVSEEKLLELFKRYLLGKQSVKGETWQVDTDPRYDALAEIAKDLSQYSKDTFGYNELKAVQQVMEQYRAKKFSAQRTSTAHNKTGQLYEVEIAAKEESFLNWFTKFDDLSPTEQESLAKVFNEFDTYGNLETADKTIGQLYQKVTRYSREGTPKRLSQALKDLGYSGIKFLDQESRNRPYEKQYFNYVVFDESTITIKDKHYSQDANGVEGFYHNGQATLVSENLTPETVVATFIHELGGHKGFQQMMSPKAYAIIMAVFDRLVAQGNPIAVAAKKRAQQAEDSQDRQTDEYIPYLLTEQENAHQATKAQRNAVQRLIDHIVRAVKGWLFNQLTKYDITTGLGKRVSSFLDARDIQLMAEKMIREMGNGTKPSNNTKAKVSQFSQLNTPQSQINAVRKKYEGTSQWMKAPNGQPTKLNEMQWLQVRTPNFKAWFGDWENDPANASKVVDENGEPMVVYHGTKSEFTEFKPTKPNFYAITEGTYFFTDNENVAANFGKYVIPVYLNIDNPTELDGRSAGRFNTWDLNDDSGNYGWIVKNSDTGGGITTEYAVENPTQIKSATDNTGEFNQTNPDIRFSRKAKNPITEGIKSAANDAKNSLPKPISGKIDHFLAGRRLPSNDVANIVSKTELSLYHRTIGTQQNTALQLPDFKKVYDMAQRYLQHVSVDAYAALQAAPNLLGQLESWSDLKKEFKKAWPAAYIKQKTDRAAVAEVIFDETLNNELRSEEDILKSLSRDQRKIYKEARDAIEVSLKNTAKSEMVRKLLAAEAINWNTVEDLMDKNLPVEQFAQSVRDLVESRIGGLSNELEAILDSDKMVKKAFKTGEKTGLSKEQKIELKKALALKAQIDTTEEALKSLNDVEKRLDTLLEQGYAPLMRFGEYTLTVRGQDDKVQSFFMFETKAEQARAANAIVERYGKTVKLETDMISKEEFKQFAGMTPETMALFAKETGMDKDAAYQHYLKLAIPARSAMTRMIKRKGTAGFSDDIQRVVASFVMSNARMAAKNIYAAQIEKSIQAIESGNSVKDQAIVMKENIFNPKENSAQLRNILFLWNLGGSIFFGLLNMTQPYLQTLPHLSQYVSIADASKAILRGSKIAGAAMKNGHAPRGYEAEYDRAVREGHVDPQNVFMLSGVERGKTGLSNSWTSILSHLMGSIAQVTESFNRKAVFIASIDVANKKGAAWLKKHGFATAYDFAVDSISQTQGVYNKANRSNWANTSVGAPLMTFKQYGINYVEQMVRMWRKKAESGDEGKKAVFLMLAMLASLSGVMGLPFMKDFLDVSETTAAFLGNPVNIEREARLVLGKDLADPIFNGVLNHYVFSVLGVDTQSRTSMGDLLPLSNALNPTLSAQGRVNEFSSIAGSTGGLIEKGYDASQFIARGNVGMAALTLLPRSVTSLITGGKMAATDEVTDSKGNKLFDTTWDEGLIKAIDATPKRMADLSRTKSLEWKDKSIQAYMTTNFKQKIIAAMMDNDQAEVQNLMKKVQEWNTSRPNYPVFINLNTLSKNANKKDQTFDARESIPKGMDWMKNERPEM